MMTYLGIIEQRINELLQANSYIGQQKQFDSKESLNFEKINFSGINPMGNKALNLETESEDDDSEEDEDEKPMGVEEFKARVMHGKGKYN